MQLISILLLLLLLRHRCSSSSRGCSSNLLLLLLLQGGPLGGGSSYSSSNCPCWPRAVHSWHLPGLLLLLLVCSQVLQLLRCCLDL
jgi:hypothetical protein